MQMTCGTALFSGTDVCCDGRNARAPPQQPGDRFLSKPEVRSTFGAPQREHLHCKACWPLRTRGENKHLRAWPWEMQLRQPSRTPPRLLGWVKGPKARRPPHDVMQLMALRDANLRWLLISETRVSVSASHWCGHSGAGYAPRERRQTGMPPACAHASPQEGYYTGTKVGKFISMGYNPACVHLALAYQATTRGDDAQVCVSVCVWGGGRLRVLRKCRVGPSHFPSPRAPGAGLPGHYEGG